MKHYALIGEKLGHSLSVPIHEGIFRRLGITADYRLIEIPRNRLAREVSRLLATLDGFNVTIPYKRDVISLLDEIDPAAQAIGAVNTVVTGSVSVGYNTDVTGFIAMLRRYGISPEGKPCYVLGSGGTSHTAVASLHRMGAKSVTVVSRHPGEEEISYAQLEEEFSGVLVNTTPAGMLYQQDTCPIRREALPALLARAAGVADVIYNPAETPLVAAARRAGVPACNGLYMLVAQAVEAEALWQGRPMPEDLTDRLMEEIHL